MDNLINALEGDPRQIHAQKLAEYLRFGRRNNFGDTLPMYTAAKNRLYDIGNAAPADLFPAGFMNDLQMRGISGFRDWLHQRRNYPEGSLGRSPLGFMGFSTGGAVPGSGQGDSVAARLTPGEIVLNRAQQSRLRERLGLTARTPQQLFKEISAKHPASGYNLRRDIADLVGIEARVRRIDNVNQPGTMHYEQHNTYHELPKDPFAESRQMKQAVHASFMT
jgi:hypothetical protein